MPSVRVNSDWNEWVFFCTLTVHRWYYLFDRHNRWSILADSLQFCMDKKGLRLYSFVFMLNHIHLIVGSHDTAGFLRDFKHFTSSAIRDDLLAKEPSAYNLFVQPDGRFQLWQKTNMPMTLETEMFALQKRDYIHLNPVRKGYVTKPEHWYWSSANTSCELRPNGEWW